MIIKGFKGGDLEGFLLRSFPFSSPSGFPEQPTSPFSTDLDFFSGLGYLKIQTNRVKEGLTIIRISGQPLL
jgi:hypothetical protein